MRNSEQGILLQKFLQGTSGFVLLPEGDGQSILAYGEERCALLRLKAQSSRLFFICLYPYSDQGERLRRYYNTGSKGKVWMPLMARVILPKEKTRLRSRCSLTI